MNKQHCLGSLGLTRALMLDLNPERHRCLGSLMAKTLACRAGVPGSIPGRGVVLSCDFNGRQDNNS